jgi:GntR family transcriptional regulator
MFLQITDLSDEPLQSQIARQIRAKILSGDLVSGGLLPSIRALAREQRVSVITVQRAYESLEREGLIHSRRGKGFFVSDLEEKRKKKLSEQRLRESLEPLFLAASAEGMAVEDILEAARKVLKKTHG